METCAYARFFLAVNPYLPATRPEAHAGDRTIELVENGHRPAVHRQDSDSSTQITDENATSCQIQRKANAFLQACCQHFVTRKPFRCYVGTVDAVALHRRIAAVSPVELAALVIDFQIDGLRKMVKCPPTSTQPAS